MTVTMWHNPRCSKSRQTLQLLRDNGVEPRVVEYLNTPPDVDELNRVVGLLNVEPRALMRTREATYRALGLAAEDDDTALIRAMAEHPILIERPVVLANGKAAVGRPPESVLAIL